MEAGAAMIGQQSALDSVLGRHLTEEEVAALCDSDSNSNLTDAPWGDGEVTDSWLIDEYYDFCDYMNPPTEETDYRGTKTMLDELSRVQAPMQSPQPSLPRVVTRPYIKKPIPTQLRWAVFRRDGYRCVKCGRDEDLTADHIHAEVKGGRTGIDNLQTLCRPCNSKKGAK